VRDGKGRGENRTKKSIPGLAGLILLGWVS
jgi:hypothetical protein